MMNITEENSLAAGCIALAAAGVASHLLYFIRGDHNRYAHRWITRSLIAVSVLGGAIFHLTRFAIIPTLISTLLLSVSYFAALFTSISLYRLFFHPLRRFPGPILARWSNLYHMHAIRASDNYLYIQRLHEKYGPIVRTGTL
jgi:tryprostatin B 6-hydroxylase